MIRFLLPISCFLLLPTVRPASVLFYKESEANAQLPDVETRLTEEDFKASAYVTRLYQNRSKAFPDLTLDDVRGVSPVPGEVRQITAINNVLSRWPNGVIPYTISSSYNWFERAWIANSFNLYHLFTKIRFVPKEEHHSYDYIYIHKGGGCWSYVGRQFGRQELSLASACFYGSAVLHELMHAAGFDHEMNRSDRDSYVQIKWENIEPWHQHNFAKVNPYSYSNIAGEYDYGSIMHYTSFAFSKNGLMTIVPQNPIGYIMGYAMTFSQGDIKKLNAMYP